MTESELEQKLLSMPHDEFMALAREHFDGIPTTYGNCTRCGCIEVALMKVKGYQDLSSIGEAPDYPYGYGCEVCMDKGLGFRSETAPDGFKRGMTYAQTRGII